MQIIEAFDALKRAGVGLKGQDDDLLPQTIWCCTNVRWSRDGSQLWLRRLRGRSCALKLWKKRVT